MNARDVIYNKYIRRFERGDDWTPRIGVEIEMPILRASDDEAPADAATLKGLFPALIKGGCKLLAYSDTGDIVAALHPNGTKISFDSSYGNIEFALAPQRSVSDVEQAFVPCYDEVLEYLRARGYRMAGRGLARDKASDLLAFDYEETQPDASFATRADMALLEHRFLREECAREPFSYYPQPDFFAMISSTQTHVEVKAEQLPLALRVFGWMDVFEILLLANSPGEFEGRDYLCGRHFIYMNSPFKKLGIVGSIDDDLRTLSDVEDMIARRKIIGRKRGNMLEALGEPVSLAEYFADPVYDAKPEDIDCFVSYHYSELSSFGTIERRIACTQPFDDLFAPCAFATGISNRLESADELLTRFIKDNRIEQKPTLLCDMAARRDTCEFFGKPWEKLAGQILDLAVAGMAAHDPFDVKYLPSLYRRIEGFRSPAKNALCFQFE